jgi:hypothetical protein
VSDQGFIGDMEVQFLVGDYSGRFAVEEDFV